MMIAAASDEIHVAGPVTELESQQVDELTALRFTVGRIQHHMADLYRAVLRRRFFCVFGDIARNSVVTAMQIMKDETVSARGSAELFRRLHRSAETPRLFVKTVHRGLVIGRKINGQQFLFSTFA